MSVNIGTPGLMVLIAFGLLISGCQTTGKKSGKVRSPFLKSASYDQKFEAGFVATGLKPIYPSNAKCREVASFFGDETRYDGSQRVQWANYGYHGGIDISAPEGIPIIAIAAGTVFQTHTGGRLVGHQIMLRHSPEDTGLPFWTVSKYKHFREMPDLEIGQRIEMGQIIGPSGKTGTTGGHYGEAGYPHLHMSVYASASGNIRLSRRGGLIAPDGKFLDPLAFFYGRIFDNHAIRALPDQQKHFAVPFKTTAGTVTPATTRVVWPFLCDPRS